MIRSARRTYRGFTIIEIMVAIGILGILAAIAIPPWAQYRARMEAYEIANALRGDLQLAKVMTLDNQSSYSVEYSAADNAYNVLLDSTEDSSTDRDPVRIVLVGQRVNLGAANWKITFAERGWVNEARSTQSLRTGGDARFVVYCITVTAPGVVDIPVRVYLDGKVDVG